jgi:CDP-6-deoxy-D-xylo-4-hexulose-3-dehydrase
LLTVKENDIFTRDDIVRSLEEKKIQTRMLFAGNLIKHPCFDEMRKEKQGYRIVGELENTEMIMKQAFWIGVYPGINDEKSAYITNSIKGFITNRERGV